MAIHPPLLLALALTLATPAALAAQDQSKVSDDIRVAAKSAVGSVTTVSGDVDLEAGARADNLTTVSGDIDIDAGVTAKAAQTVSGDIQGDAVVQLGDAETVSGDIELGPRGRAGDVQTVSGNIEFDIGGRLASAETVSGDVFINRTSLYGGIAALLRVGASLLFFRTRLGTKLRAVSDDHVASWSVGISVERAVGVSWGLAGICAVGAGTIWGAVQGVSGGTGMGHNLQHYKDIIVTPTAYGQGLTFLMLTELMIQDA